MKRPGSKSTTIEIDQYQVVKTYCAARGTSVREYVNRLIASDIMRNADVRTSMMYFKGVGGDV